MANRNITKNSQAAWSGLVLVVVTFMLIGVYFLRLDGTELVDDNIDPNLVIYKSKVADAAVDTQSMMQYNNADYGFNLFYPVNSQITTQSSAEGELEIFTVNIEKDDNEVTVNAMPVEMEGFIRTSITINEEYDIAVDQREAVRIDGSSVKDGTDMSLVIIEKGENLITIQGTGQNFEDIISYFEII